MPHSLSSLVRIKSLSVGNPPAGKHEYGKWILYSVASVGASVWSAVVATVWDDADVSESVVVVVPLQAVSETAKIAKIHNAKHYFIWQYSPL